MSLAKWLKGIDYFYIGITLGAAAAAFVGFLAILVAIAAAIWALLS